MKKLLSITLAVAMVMSLFCVVPASAASPAAGVYKAPYWFEDFENGTSPFAEKVATEKNPVAYTSEVVSTGDPERGMVAKMVVSGSTNDGGGIQGESSISIKVGDKITMSAWIKSEQTLNKGELSLIFFPSVGGYKCWTLDFDKNNTDWQYVTKTITADWEGTTGGISYRWGNTGGLNFSTADVKADAEAGTEAVINDRTYYVDNFELKIERPVVEERAYSGCDVVSLTAEDGSTWNNIEILQKGSTDTFSVASETITVPATEEGGEATTETNTFLRHTHTAAAPIWYGIKLAEPMKSGHVYVLTFKNRIRGLPTEDGTLDPAGPAGGTGFDYVNYQSTIPYNGAAWTGEISKGSYESWSVHSAANRIANTANGPYLDNRWHGANKAATDYSEWHNVQIVYASTKQTIEGDMSNKDYIRIGTWLYNGSGANLGTFDFDDFKVVDLGPLTNGSFEYSSLCYSSGIHDGSGAAQWIGGNKKLGGWHAPNPHGTAQSLKGAQMSGAGDIGALYYQYTEASEIYQYVPMYAYESYTIKGYVRGASSNGTYTKGRARLVADFTGDTLDQEVYDVLSIGDNGVIYGDWVEFGSSYNANAPMVLNVDLTNIGLIKDTTTAEDGSTVITSRKPVNNIVPKSAKVSIQFDETWEGNVNPPNGGHHAVYMDNFTLTRNATALPVAAEATAAMDLDGNLAVDYNFTTVGSAADASVYKLTGDGKTVVFYNKNAIIVPESMREASDLQLTVMPYVNGYFGEEVTVPVSMPVRPAVVQMMYEDGMVYVYSDTDFESVYLIFATYDENGKMIAVEEAPLTLVADQMDAYGTTLDAAYKTKAFIIADYSSLKPLTDSIEW